MSTSFRDQLFSETILHSSGVDGLYGRGDKFEKIHDGLDTAITRIGKDQKAEKFRFSPALPFAGLKKNGYMGSFPQLAGTVHCFCGTERDQRDILKSIEVGDDAWTKEQVVSEVALTPAACYPVYPLLAERGTVPSQGYTVDVMSWCFRHEPSIDPMRMQMFRMREYVRVGTPQQVETFRNMWMQRCQEFVGNLALPFEIDVANDPFFGRGGAIMSDAQRQQRLKFELLIPVNPDKLSACISFNYHMNHFGEIYEMYTDDGELTHTSCIGFGMERLTLALLKHHGFDLTKWPSGVIEFLALDVSE
jgi:seryl-tRNA synthetase